MGFFSRLFEKNDSRNSNNAQALHTSITRALAGVVYYDLTVGQIARALGDTEARQHVNNVISSLIQALLQNGTANGDETIESLVSDKVQRFHESDLKLKDLDPCVMSFLVWAADDAKKSGASEEIRNRLLYGCSAFAEIVTSEDQYEDFLRQTVNSTKKYELVAEYVDTGRKSPEYDSMLKDEDDIESEEHYFQPEPATDILMIPNEIEDKVGTSGGSPKATPLFNAVIDHNYYLVHNALVEGADPNIRSFAGYKADPYSIEREPGIPDKALSIMRRQALDKTKWPQLFYKPELGFTNLYFPAMEGDIVTTHLLLEAGADPNARSLNGLFPLYTAAEHGHINVVKELVEHGADVNQKTPKGCTALLNAAEEGQGDVVVYLLKNGANPSIANEFGKTPRQGAEEYGHSKLAALLFNYECFGEMPRPPFDDDIYSWSRNILRRDVSEREYLAANSRLLMNSLKLDKSDPKEDSISIALAIENQDLSMLSKAIESGGDVNVKHVHGGKRITPIVEAALLNNQEMVEILLEAGADPNIPQDNGETALMNAAQNGNFSIVSMLLEAGANPNATAYAGTALAVADNAAIIFELCQKGADPNIGDSDGDLPIIGFINEHRYEAVLALLICGTDIEHRNDAGVSAIDHAECYGDKDIADLLVNGNLRDNTSSKVGLDSVREVLEERIEKLLDLSYPLNYFISCNSKKYQALITDSQKERAQQAKALVNEAIDRKRSGDLTEANSLYIKATADEDILALDTVWGWFKVLLLSKNFKDAQLILRYYHALAASRNHLLKNEGELDFNNTLISSCFLTLQFDAFTVFGQAANAWPMDRDAVENKISAFGGSERWSNYNLSPDSYDSFIRYFGYPEMYEFDERPELSEEEKLERAVRDGDASAHVQLAKRIYGSDRVRAIELCERAIKLGDFEDDGAFFLAWLISDENPTRAVELYEKCVDDGHFYGPANNLALLLEKDEPERAKELYQKAIDAGNTLNAAKNLANLLKHDDPKRAAELYRMAIEAGDEFASTFQLAMLIEEDDPSAAIELYKRSINAGDTRASSERAAELLKATDPEQAADLFEMSAKAGNLDAYVKLARTIYSIDRDRAIAACEQAVADGDVNDGAFFLAWLLEGTDRDRSVELYQTCIDNNFAYGAGRNLGNLLRESNPTKALAAYTAALDCGNVGVLFNIGLVHMYSDKDLAIEAYSKAIEAGFPDGARVNLAHIYMLDNPSKAKELYEVSAEEGETEALIGLALLESEQDGNEVQGYIGEIRNRSDAEESFDFMIDYFGRFDEALAKRVKLLSEKYAKR